MIHKKIHLLAEGMLMGVDEYLRSDPQLKEYWYPSELTKYHFGSLSTLKATMLETSKNSEVLFLFGSAEMLEAYDDVANFEPLFVENTYMVVTQYGDAEFLQSLLGEPEIKERVPTIVLYYDQSRAYRIRGGKGDPCPYKESEGYTLIKCPDGEPDLAQVRLAVKKAVDFIKERQSRQLLESYDGTIIGKSKAIQEVLQSVELFARTDVPILILGNTGTGKELVAKAIHERSRRHGGNWVPFNCAAFSPELAESELFGHEKGSFTGATVKKIGLFQGAQGGTIFLDEIGILSPAIQAKLLRVLQEKTSRTVGGTKDIEVDFRVIAATNENIRDMIAQGKFREDLFHRLNGATIELPPLSQRREDIELLVDHFLNRFNALYKKDPAVAISRDAVALLKGREWNGNVRELMNFMERAIIRCTESVITIDQVQQQLGKDYTIDKRSPQFGAASKDEIEKHNILEVLNQNNWNKSKTAKILDIDVTTLYKKIEKFELKKPG